MPFGEIFTGAFGRIWRHKKLWLLAMFGLALTGLGMLVNSLLSMRWLGGYMEWLNAVMRNPTNFNSADVRAFMDSMTWIWAAGGLAGLLSLVGYVINLVARGAIITEANYAWRDRRTDAGRGLRHGLNRAAHVFLIDLIWWLPAVLLVIGGFVAFFVLLAGSASADSSRAGIGGVIASSWLAFLCGGCCLFVLYAVVKAVFAPLMYQSTVAGEQGVGAAISEGWGLARRNLGALIILWILLLLVGLVLNAVFQSLTTAASFPLIRDWMTYMTDLVSGLEQGVMPEFPTMSWPWFGLLSVVSTIVWFLITSFTQALNLTVYAGAYQHLTGVAPAGESALPVAPVAVPPDAPLVPPAESVENELPPTL